MALNPYSDTDPNPIINPYASDETLTKNFNLLPNCQYNMAMLRCEIETVFAVNSSGKHFNLRDVITDHGSDSK